jgi:small subunit ribosomal protein S6
VATETWGRRNLAYPIKKYGTGHYVLQRFEMNPGGTAELDRLLRFNENVMRYLLTRTDE